LYALADVKVRKVRMMRWPGHVACTGLMLNVYSMLVRNNVVNRRIILKWILKRDDDVVLAWIDFLIRLL